MNALLTSIAIEGGFDQIGADAQLPITRKGNKYAVVFMDYLIKWLEVYPTKDRMNQIIIKLLVKQFLFQDLEGAEWYSDGQRAEELPDRLW